MTLIELIITDFLPIRENLSNQCHLCSKIDSIIYTYNYHNLQFVSPHS